MGNVWEAMKKHEAEHAEQAAQSPAPAPAPAVEAAAPSGVRNPPLETGATSNNYSPVLMAHHDRGCPTTEQYRALRTHLFAQYPDERFCMVVTSSEVGEGKTVTSLNLAMVLTERQERKTIVVDCDMRRGKIASLLRAENRVGMAQVLAGRASLPDVIAPTVYPNLFVIPSGQAKADEVGELIAKPELFDVVSDLRRRYDFVLFDTPPINVVSDAGMLGRAAGEALLVVRMNKTHRESVDKAIRLLHAANVKLVGLVLTHQKYYIPNYLYRYS